MRQKGGGGSHVVDADEAAGRGLGTGRALIERCRQRCGEQGAIKLVWETAIDNTTAQRLYDGIGAEQSAWYTYEIDAL